MALSKEVRCYRCYHCRIKTPQGTQAKKYFECKFCGKKINIKKAQEVFKSKEQYELRLFHRGD